MRTQAVVVVAAGRKFVNETKSLHEKTSRLAENHADLQGLARQSAAARHRSALKRPVAVHRRQLGRESAALRRRAASQVKEKAVLHDLHEQAVVVAAVQAVALLACHRKLVAQLTMPAKLQLVVALGCFLRSTAHNSWRLIVLTGTTECESMRETKRTTRSPNPGLIWLLLTLGGCYIALASAKGR